MAQFDLGTLYQRLKLDVSDFEKGIKRSLDEYARLETKVAQGLAVKVRETTRERVSDDVRQAQARVKAEAQAVREAARLREADERSKLRAHREADIALAKRVQSELKGQTEISNGWRRYLSNINQVVATFFAWQMA